jgi:hypothetical protein
MASTQLLLPWADEIRELSAQDRRTSNFSTRNASCIQHLIIERYLPATHCTTRRYYALPLLSIFYLCRQRIIPFASIDTHGKRAINRKLVT